MSEINWRTFGYIGVALGVLLLIGGFVAYFFPQDVYFLGIKIGTTYPYRDSSFGLFVVGIVLSVFGGGAWWRADAERQRNIQGVVPAQSVSKRFCRFCGAENKTDAVFCEKCGKPVS